MEKAERQQKIRKIITNESIEWQEDLVARLREIGLTVTQAIISRDIKEIQLIEIPADNGGYHYDLPTYHHQRYESQLTQTFQDSLEQLKRNDCSLALTIHPGNGPVVATLIRKMNFPAVFTTIGDDGSVLAVYMSPEAVIKLEEKLSTMLG